MRIGQMLTWHCPNSDLNSLWRHWRIGGLHSFSAKYLPGNISQCFCNRPDCMLCSWVLLSQCIVAYAGRGLCRENSALSDHPWLDQGSCYVGTCRHIVVKSVRWDKKETLRHTRAFCLCPLLSCLQAHKCLLLRLTAIYIRPFMQVQSVERVPKQMMLQKESGSLLKRGLARAIASWV